MATKTPPGRSQPWTGLEKELAALQMPEAHRWWELWLLQAQASNDRDEHSYSHGVFGEAPRAEPDPASASGSA